MYKILKSFVGSQAGTANTNFTAGETVELSDYLVSCVNPKWIEKAVDEKPEIKVTNKAIVTTGKAKKGARK